MKLVKLNCPNCNSPLDIPDGKKKVKCKFCGTPIILDDESIKISHTIYSGEKEEEFKNAEALLKLKEYDDALYHFQKLSDKYIYEANIWYSMVVCITHDFEYFEVDENGETLIDLSDNSLCADYMQKYVKLETDEELKEKRVKKFEKYKDEYFLKAKEASNKLLIEKNKTEAEANKKIGIILLVAAIGIIALITPIIVRKLNSFIIEREVSIHSYFNNSQDAGYELQEVKSSDALCYHFDFRSKNKNKEYKLQTKVYKYGVLNDEYVYEDKFKDDYIGWYCYNLEKKDRLPAGIYEFVLLDSNENILDKNNIKVVK